MTYDVVRWARAGMGMAALAWLLACAADPRPGRGVEPAAPAAGAASRAADNPLGGCAICHVDIEKAFLKSSHDRGRVTCVKCHGPSEGHIRDENNNVKPDEVFARKDVDRACARCHGCSRTTDLAFAAGAAKICTDCHGSHKTVRKPGPAKR